MSFIISFHCISLEVMELKKKYLFVKNTHLSKIIFEEIQQISDKENV